MIRISNQHLKNVELAFAGETLTLMASRCVFWATQRTLFLADLHLGKEATFRAAAFPIPDQTEHTLERLTRVVRQTRAERLMILGDLLHARKGRCERMFELVSEWRTQFSELSIELVRGNHDQSAGDPPSAWQIKCVAEPSFTPPFSLRHHPKAAPGTFVLAGHLHPAVRLGGPGRDSAKLPCFLLQDNVLILPAFSEFVDGATVRARQGDQVFAICETQVLKIGS